MKKLVFLVAAAALSSSIFAQEAAAPAASAQPAESRRAMNDNWPAFFAVAEYPANPDVVGLPNHFLYVAVNACISLFVACSV